MRNTMSAQVGAPPGSTDRVVALGALRMIHDLFAVTAERGLNVFLPKYGYEVHGFANSLNEPGVKEAVGARNRRFTVRTKSVGQTRARLVRGVDDVHTA